MRTADNLGSHELIGLKVTVMRNDAAEQEGVVIDETMNTFRLFTGTKRIMVPKEGRDFVFRMEDGRSVKLCGDAIMFRPEDRTKKVRKSQSKDTKPEEATQ